MHENGPSVMVFRKVKGKVCVLIALFFSWFTRDGVAKLLSKLNV